MNIYYRCSVFSSEPVTPVGGVTRKCFDLAISDATQIKEGKSECATMCILKQVLLDEKVIENPECYKFLNKGISEN